MYEEIHIVIGVIHIVFGGFAGYRAIMALKTIYENPETLQNQKVIWMPILVGAAMFPIGGIFHIATHLLQSPELDLLHEIALVVGLLFFMIGILRYSKLLKRFPSIPK